MLRLNELTLEIDPAHIVEVCRFLKEDQKLNRLSGITVSTGIRRSRGSRSSICSIRWSAAASGFGLNAGCRRQCRNRFRDAGLALAQTGMSAKSSTFSACVSEIIRT